MRIHWLEILAVALALVLSAPASARLDLSKDEREIVEWLQPANPALTFEASLFKLLAAEDVTRRTLLLERCPIRVWSSPARFANPKYAAVMSESARAVDKLLAQAIESQEIP